MNGSGNQVEKWILRKACEDLLPKEIVWRYKEQFDEGSGTVDVVTKCLDSFIGKFDTTLRISNNPNVYIRSSEEAAYYEIFTGTYSDSPTILNNVARWAYRN